jgi:hypothetical protein
MAAAQPDNQHADNTQNTCHHRGHKTHWHKQNPNLKTYKLRRTPRNGKFFTLFSDTIFGQMCGLCVIGQRR